LVKLVKKKSDPDLDYLPNTLRIAELAFDVKALDIRAYQVRELTLIADAFVVCSAGSEAQSKAIVKSVRRGMKEIGVSPLHCEGEANMGWMVLDYGSIIVHIFREESRKFYDLDGLWADAPLLDLDFDSE
jgi:ribosome-associated protein